MVSVPRDLTRRDRKIDEIAGSQVFFDVLFFSLLFPSNFYALIDRSPQSGITDDYGISMGINHEFSLTCRVSHFFLRPYLDDFSTVSIVFEKALRSLLPENRIWRFVIMFSEMRKPICDTNSF